MKKPFVLLWSVFAAVLLFSWVYLPSLSKYHDLKQQQNELDQQIAKFTRDVETIREERDLLKNDPEYLEKVIRDEMGLVKPGEIVYKFVQETPEDMADEIEVPEPVLIPPKLPSPTPAASGFTVQARPVVPSITPRNRPLPSSNAEPVYPRRETR